MQLSKGAAKGAAKPGFRGKRKKGRFIGRHQKKTSTKNNAMAMEPPDIDEEAVEPMEVELAVEVQGVEAMELAVEVQGVEGVEGTVEAV